MATDDLRTRRAEEIAERRKEEREHPPPEPEPFDPTLPGGRFWPPTIGALNDLEGRQ